MIPEVVIEGRIPPHRAGLYRADARATGVPGFAGAAGEAAVERFRREGYLLVEGGFDDDAVTAARERLRAMTLADDPQCQAVYYESLIRDHVDPAPPPASDGARPAFAIGEALPGLPALEPTLRAGFVRKFMTFTANHPPLRRIAFDPALLDLATRLIGAAPRMWQEMAMIKPPGGREKPWHQDHAYFDLPLETPILGVWIPLHPVDEKNGCMFLLPGGHRAGPRAHVLRRDWQICDEDVLALTQTAVPMAPGDVLLFDAKLPHGTPTNQTDEIRWAVQFHFVPADVATADPSVRLGAFGTEGKTVNC